MKTKTITKIITLGLVVFLLVEIPSLVCAVRFACLSEAQRQVNIKAVTDDIQFMNEQLKKVLSENRKK
jgi:hypothetical protein